MSGGYPVRRVSGIVSGGSLHVHCISSPQQGTLSVHCILVLDLLQPASVRSMCYQIYASTSWAHSEDKLAISVSHGLLNLNYLVSIVGFIVRIIFYWGLNIIYPLSGARVTELKDEYIWHAHPRWSTAIRNGIYGGQRQR